MIGLAGDCTVNNKDIFTELLLVDVLRGHHSTGAALVRRWNDEILVHKAPVPSTEFIGTKQYKDFIDQLGVKVLIGHNRYATVGDKTEANAHPFEFDNLVGAHNGTLDNYALKRLEGYKDFGTDSEALYNSVSKRGIKPTIGDLTGAWALTWFDKENNTINLLRNGRRPLYYAYSEDRHTLYWASEADMLEWILKRNKVKLFENSVYECQADTHYRWTLPEKINTALDKPVISEVKERAFVNNAHGFSYKAETDWFDRRNDSVYGGGGDYNQAYLAVPIPKTTKAPEKIDTAKFRPPYKDASGKIIKKPEFLELVAGCCVFCDNSDSEWGEFIYPLKEDMDGRKLYLCEDCYNDDDIRELIENSL